MKKKKKKKKRKSSQNRAMKSQDENATNVLVEIRAVIE